MQTPFAALAWRTPKDPTLLGANFMSLPEVSCIHVFAHGAFYFIVWVFLSQLLLSLLLLLPLPESLASFSTRSTGSTN